MSHRLPVRMEPRPWGRAVLSPPFTAPAGEVIGEVCFTPPPSLESLLVKYIFTSAPLSVQVHPSDADAQGRGLARRGKEECWLVIAAEPDARLGIGFTEDLSAEAMRAAALDGSIEHLLEWHPAAAGDFFYIPADVPHLPYNPSQTEDVVAVIARTDPNEQESVVLLPELEKIHSL